jgi:hypothetical protein
MQFTVAAPFYGVRSDKPQLLGFRDPNCISHRLGAVHHRTHPVTVRVSGLGETGFKSMSSSGRSLPSHGDTITCTGDLLTEGCRCNGSRDQCAAQRAAACQLESTRIRERAVVTPVDSRYRAGESRALVPASSQVPESSSSSESRCPGS